MSRLEGSVAVPRCTLLVLPGSSWLSATKQAFVWIVQRCCLCTIFRTSAQAANGEWKAAISHMSSLTEVRVENCMLLSLPLFI